MMIITVKDALEAYLNFLINLNEEDRVLVYIIEIFEFAMHQMPNVFSSP